VTAGRREQLRNDCPGRSLRLHRRRPIQLDTASARLGPHTSLRGIQPNATRPRLNFRRPSDLAQFHGPAAGRGFHGPAALIDPNTTPSRLQDRALQAGKKPAPTRGAPLTDFKGAELQLAGFFPEDPIQYRVDVDGPSQAVETLRGAQIAQERGWTAPVIEDVPLPEVQNR